MNTTNGCPPVVRGRWNTNTWFFAPTATAVLWRIKIFFPTTKYCLCKNRKTYNLKIKRPITIEKTGNCSEWIKARDERLLERVRSGNQSGVSFKATLIPDTFHCLGWETSVLNEDQPIETLVWNHSQALKAVIGSLGQLLMGIKIFRGNVNSKTSSH